MQRKFFLIHYPDSSFAIYNSDDPHSKDLIHDTKAKIISYGTSSNSDFKLKNINYDLSGTTFDC
jgi:UDP-N-acetylmuramyl tripeptide synthase